MARMVALNTTVKMINNMIESIDIESSRIEMCPPAGEDGKRHYLFNADSFNILIGDNGSGKTHALRRIAAAMQDSGVTLGCQVNMAVSEGGGGVDDFGVVYYTSIPYSVKLPKKGARFMNASVNFAKNSVVGDVDIEQFMSLAKLLKMPTKPVITMSYNPGLLMPMLARTLVRCINQNSDVDSFLSEIFPVDHIRAQAGVLMKALGLPFKTATDEEMREKRISPKAFELAQHLCEVIHLLVHERLGSNTFPVLSAIEELVAESKDVTAVCIVFFNNALKLNLGRASRFPKTEERIQEKVESHCRAKVEIFEADQGWEVSDHNGVLTAETEYQKSEILSRFPQAEIENLVSIQWENFSSGQLALLYQFTALRKAAREMHRRGLKNLLLLVDEGDIFLHATWQRRYVELLNILFGQIRKEFDYSVIQAVVTTHSPAVITDMPAPFIVRLDRNARHGRPPIVGFAAAPQDIVNSSFDTDSLGSFSAQLLSKTARSIKRNGPTSRDRYVISLIDDPVIKREFIRLCSMWSDLSEGAE